MLKKSTSEPKSKPSQFQPQSMQKSNENNETVELAGFVFCLTNVNMLNLDKQYNLDILANSDYFHASQKKYMNQNQISDLDILLDTSKNQDTKSVVDKNNFRISPVTISTFFQTNVKSLDAHVPCWYCVRCFDHVPLSFPLNKISKEMYTTIGKFCSFNCVVAFQKCNCEPVDEEYNSNRTLIENYYCDIFGFKINGKITKSPPWQFLENNGGNLTDKEYNEQFQTVEYENLNQYKRKF